MIAENAAVKKAHRENLTKQKTELENELKMFEILDLFSCVIILLTFDLKDPIHIKVSMVKIFRFEFNADREREQEYHRSSPTDFVSMCLLPIAGCTSNR